MLQSSNVTKEGRGSFRGHIPHTKKKKWTYCFAPNTKEQEQGTLELYTKSILMNEIADICRQSVVFPF